MSKLLNKNLSSKYISIISFSNIHTIRTKNLYLEKSVCECQI